MAGSISKTKTDGGWCEVKPFHGRPTWDDFLDSAALAGIDEDAFWNLTPRECERSQWAFIKKRRIEEIRVISTGWWVANLMKQRRLPSLNTLITPTKIVKGEEKARLDAEFNQMAKEMGM
jgi:hypothetical protein